MISRLLSPSPEAAAALPPRFEDLLGRLEQIVGEMENAEMPLEKLLSGYEEGMRLVKACGDRLADAEQKVEILSRSVSVEPAKPAPLATGEPSTPASPAEPAPSSVDEEIRLF